MSSPCRTTSLLVSKESDGQIAYKSREKSDVLSLGFLHVLPLHHLFSLHVFFSFIPSFFLFFLFLFSPSHFPFIFSSFSLLLWSFSLPFWSNHSFGQKEENSSPFPLTICVAINFSSLFPYFLNPFYDIITTWLNMSHGIQFPHMANCESFLFMPSVTLLRCHVASPYLATWHPTSHASKSVKSRPSRNPTKFDVVAKFRETISTEKSVSSSEI